MQWATFNGVICEKNMNIDYQGNATIERTQLS